MKRITSGFHFLSSSRVFHIILGFLLSGFAFYLSLRRVDYREVWTTFAQASFLYVGLALVSVAINTLAKAVRWNILFGQSGKHIPFSRICAVLLVGQMLNNLLPARVGDVTRIYIFGREGIARMFMLGTILLEKILDMLSYACIFFLLLITIPLPEWVIDPAYFLSVVAFALLTGLVILVWQQAWLINTLNRAIHWLPVHRQEKMRLRLQSGMASLEIFEIRSNRLWLIVWSAAIWITAVLNNYFTLLALHISMDMPIIAAMLILVILQVGVVLPSAPGTIGIFQYGCVVALSLFGVNESVGFSYGILLHVIVMVPTTLVGLLLFWFMDMSEISPKR